MFYCFVIAFQIQTKKRNRLDSKRLSDLTMQFNLKIRTKMATTRNNEKKRDILLAKDARYAAAWLMEGYNEDENFYPGTNIHLGVVSEAAGTDEYSQPKRTTRRTTKASSAVTLRSGSREADGMERNPTMTWIQMKMRSQLRMIDGDALRDEILLLGTASDEG